MEIVIPTSMVQVPMTGLNPLIGLGQFKVKQQTEMLEAALNAINIDYEGANKYKVLDPSGKEMYFVAEESNCCYRLCCNPSHPMKLHVTDMAGQKIMTMDRPWAYNCCLLECGNMCGLHKMNVFMGDNDDEDNRIGSVSMPICGGGCAPTLEIKDKGDNVQAKVVGPYCCISDLCGAKFEVKGPNDEPFGAVEKLGVDSVAGAVQEALTDADNYNISFPQQLPVEFKALMMGSLLLLDYMFFESEGAFEIDPCNGTCKFKLCDCYLCGCIIPCTCKCGGTQSEDSGSPPAPDIVLELPAAPTAANMLTRE